MYSWMSLSEWKYAAGDAPYVLVWAKNREWVMNVNYVTSQLSFMLKSLWLQSKAKTNLCFSEEKASTAIAKSCSCYFPCCDGSCSRYGSTLRNLGFLCCNTKQSRRVLFTCVQQLKWTVAVTRNWLCTCSSCSLCNLNKPPYSLGLHAIK